MDNEPLVKNWHAAIIKDCVGILGRTLSEAESIFIMSRGGFIALEMIHDHVKSLVEEPEELQRYLNSEVPNTEGTTIEKPDSV